MVNIFATIPGLFLVDKCGRTVLMKWSAVGATVEIYGLTVVLFCGDGFPRPNLMETAILNSHPGFGGYFLIEKYYEIVGEYLVKV